MLQDSPPYTFSQGGITAHAKSIFPFLTSFLSPISVLKFPLQLCSGRGQGFYLTCFFGFLWALTLEQQNAQLEVHSCLKPDMFRCWWWVYSGMVAMTPRMKSRVLLFVLMWWRKQVNLWLETNGEGFGFDVKHPRRSKKSQIVFLNMFLWRISACVNWFKLLFLTGRTDRLPSFLVHMELPRIRNCTTSPRETKVTSLSGTVTSIVVFAFENSCWGLQSVAHNSHAWI